MEKKQDGFWSWMMKGKSNKLFVLVLGLSLITAPVWAADYRKLKPAELKIMLENKDFFLLDVHVPEKIHIPGTDAFIDYRNIQKIVATIPAEKDAKIVIYCLSDGMSRQVARNLTRLGYTNVYQLKGGTSAFNSVSSTQ
jgi:rhodanese-related sulfurtransferase